MATSTADAEDYDLDKYWVAPARNFRSSARLYLQHLLMQNTLGYFLEPVIEKSIVTGSQPLKVADLACGNGTASTFNPVNFPDPAHLPASVSLKQLDILAKPLPAELSGVYDVVHIRALGSIISNGDITPVLSVASEILKPGGFLQWEECRGDRFVAESPSPQVSKISCDTITHMLAKRLEVMNVRHDWMEAIDSHLTQYGLQNARLLVQEKRKQDLKGWTDNYLMVWEEVAVFFPPKAKEPNSPFPREAWVDLFAKAVKETEQGVVIHQKKVFTGLGQKPL
ncbi:hypothetical protein GGR52DRAFT_583516 [Hypoxylon sp. FL1284]|nr:hypothetical protein GGR52DRAFT_583516 [Hypoxylon sp. FL1284]